MKGLPFFFFLLALFAVSGCGSVSPPEAAAREFMESYYVRTDLKGALGVTAGLAEGKVRQGLSLIQDQVIDESTHRPKISYHLLESRTEGSEATYLYRVEIRADRSDPIYKKTRLKVRGREGHWKVTQFSDQDQAPGQNNE